MSRRDYSAAVRAAKELNAGLRAGDAATPLVSPYTKGHKAGNGRTAEKTLTQAVKQAEAARDEAVQWGKGAMLARTAAEKAGAQADEVCGRAVLVCACCALCSLLPWAVWLVCFLLGNQWG